MDKYQTNYDDVYCYPGTDVLINLHDVRDFDEFEQLEALLTASAITMSPTPPGLRYRDPPYHLKTMGDIHQALFGNIYQWAGRLRRCDIFKGGTPFCNVNQLESYAAKLFRNLETDNWLQGLTRHDFCQKLAEHYCEFNMLHPFREGNGRTQRVMFDFIAARNGYHIDWALIGSDEWIDANVLGVGLDYSAMARLFERAIK